MQKIDFKPKNPKEYLQQIINFAYLSIGIPLLIFAWLYLRASRDALEPLVTQSFNIALYVLTTFGMAGVVVYTTIKFKKLMNEAWEKEDLLDKLVIHKKAVMMKFGLYALTALFIDLAFYLSASQFFGALFTIMFILFSINNPSLPSIVKDLQLKGRNREVMLKNVNFEEQ